MACVHPPHGLFHPGAEWIVRRLVVVPTIGECSGVLLAAAWSLHLLNSLVVSSTNEVREGRVASVDLEAKLDEWEPFHNLIRPHGTHRGKT